MKRFFAILLAAAAAVFAFAANAAPLYAPTWTQADAAAAIARVDTARELQALHELARARDDAALLQRLAAVMEQRDWPAPAREYVLFSFAQSLSDLPPGAVDARVLDRLAATRPTVRVPHPDDDRLGVVMFNIPAAAAGARAEWRRQDAARQAAQRLAGDAERWIDGFLAGDRVEREGFLDALRSAPSERLRALADAVAPRLETEPALAAAAAWSGILLRDAPLFAQALAGPPPAGLAELARRAADAFDPVPARQAAATIAASAPAPTAAVVLAEWAPLLLRDSGGADLLFGLVDDEALGQAAALALARNGDEATRARLADIAAESKGPAARRAAIALSGPAGAEDAR